MRISEWLEDRGSAKMITREGGRDYLWRAFLLRMPDLPQVYLLHTFYMSDPDPPHDHPWDWGRLILRGRYTEHRPGLPAVECGPGHLVRRRAAEELHRVELITPSVTTLFWHWPRRRRWCFLRDGELVPVPDAERDVRPLRGHVLPRKVGPSPLEVHHP